MALVPVNTRNRVNPFEVSTIQQIGAAYGHPQPCLDPYCQICRGEKIDHHHKHHHKRHHDRHHHHHHHRKHKAHFWDEILSRGDSASSTATIHNIQLNDRSYYSPQVTERALVPVNQSERQLVSTTRTRAFEDERIGRESWPNYNSPDDEVVCCRAYDGCRCPCWCCIILVILTVILLIVLIVLLATLL